LAVFTVKLVARPDARMVEVPLEIDAELPREFEGVALLAASGLPRKVKIKAPKDSVKLSTAYRADQLVADIVKVALRGNAHDVSKVQDAAQKFIRTVRERRLNGATLLVTSNGRGKIEIAEQLPGAKSQATPAEIPKVQLEKIAALEKRLSELESAFARIAGAGELAERVKLLEERLTTLQAQMARTLVASEVAGPGMERPGAQVIQRTPGGTRRATAVDAFAEGLRDELRARVSAQLAGAERDTERCDRAAALAAEAERLLGAPRDGTFERLREASSLAAARLTGLQRLQEEIDLYEPADLPVASQLLTRLEDAPAVPDPAPSLEPVAQAVVRAAKGGDSKARTRWLQRAAQLCGWVLVEPLDDERLDSDLHQAIDEGGREVTRLASPGVRRTDGSVLVRARVHVDPAARDLPPEPDEAPAVPEPILPPPSMPPVPPDGAAPSAPPRPADDIIFSDEDGGEEEEVIAPGHPAPLFSEPPPPPPPEEVTRPVQIAMPPPPPPPPETPPPSPFSAPFGDLTGEGEIRADEAAAAAVAAARMPKIVEEDPSHLDEALAAEVALAVETETSADPEWAKLARGPEAFDSRPAGPDEEPDYEVSDEDVEEVHQLQEPLPPEPEKK
jgi:hypothetical protein